jgi:hypothetical protein
MGFLPFDPKGGRFIRDHRENGVEQCKVPTKRPMTDARRHHQYPKFLAARAVVL